MQYRIYYCSQKGTRLCAEDFDATTDSGAIERGRGLAAARIPLFEIWCNERLVYRGNQDSNSRRMRVAIG
jgi:hypothetical protein